MTASPERGSKVFELWREKPRRGSRNEKAQCLCEMGYSRFKPRYGLAPIGAVSLSAIVQDGLRAACTRFADAFVWFCITVFTLLLFRSFVNGCRSLVLCDVERADDLLLTFRRCGELFFVLERLVELVR